MDDPNFKWSTEIARWDYGINTEKATTEELNRYCRTKTKDYQLRGHKDECLWDIFQDDFKDFTKEHFSQLARKNVWTLRDVLRCGGVYVAKNGKSKTYAQTLVEVVQREDEHI